MNKHEKINYIELSAKDLQATKAFFTAAFSWIFADYGPEYIAFSEEGINGGFYQSDLCSTTANGSTLVVFYSEDLNATLQKVTDAGGEILKPIFTFPGGSRFHFSEPSGSKFSIWSDKVV